MADDYAEHGVEFSLPDEWNHRDGYWQCDDGSALSVEFFPRPLDLSDSLLDTYCQDLRLDAAREGGGLIECEKSELGLTAITKRPRGEGAPGFSYEGNTLIPVETGFLDIHVTHHEEDITGVRESFVIEIEKPATDNEGNLIGWQADPYGYRPQDTPFFDNLFGHKTNPLLAQLNLFARSDDAKYDKEFPDHPLTHVRKWQAWLKEHVAVIETPFPHRKDQRYPLDGVALDLPLGFYHNTEAPDPGEWFERPTFNGRSSRLGVVLHPEFPDACESSETAETAVLREIDESDVELLAAPISYEVEIASQPGILTACETEHGKKRFFDISFFLPWGKASLEVAAIFENDDYERAMLAVEAIVPSLEQA